MINVNGLNGKRGKGIIYPNQNDILPKYKIPLVLRNW